MPANMVSTEALVAHILRRTTFGPRPGEVAERSAAGVGGVLESVLNDTGKRWVTRPRPKDADQLAAWWLARMAGEQGSTLREKMTWFWHGHLTTSSDKVDSVRLLVGQYALLWSGALGSFEQLVANVTSDPAMLIYLDGDGSTADAPNENFGRELMELFTLGRGHYTQADVRAAATALAGWAVDDRGTAGFDPGSATGTPVTFLGHTGVFRAADVVHVVTNHPACAPLIAAKLYRYLVGADPDPATLDRLAAGFRTSRLSIAALVGAIVRGPQFMELRNNRCRYPVEWLAAAAAVLGVSDGSTLLDLANTLGQVPFQPPNVAGWPPGSRWLDAAARLAEMSFALGAAAPPAARRPPDTVEAALARCGLYEVSDQTTRALNDLAESIADPGDRRALVLAAAVMSPEFALA